MTRTRKQNKAVRLWFLYLGFFLVLAGMSVPAPVWASGLEPSQGPPLQRPQGAGPPPPPPPGIVTFANFIQTVPGNQWDFVGGAFPGGAATFSSSTLVQFQFLDALGSSGVPIGVEQLAYLRLASATTTPGFRLDVVGQRLVFQPLYEPGNTLSIHRFSDGANLLTMTFAGDLSGIEDTTVGSLTASTGASTQFVEFTSDFIDFSQTDYRAMSLSFSSILPQLRLAGATGQSFLRDFAASGTGTFDASVSAVPEPSTLAIGALSVLGLLGYGWRRHRQPEDKTD